MVTGLTGLTQVTGIAVARVHDLVELSPTAVIELCGQAAQDGASWVAESLDTSAWAVVRRARPVHGHNVAVGVRGPLRHQRWGADVPVSDIVRTLRPADLAFRCRPLMHGICFRARGVPAEASVPNSPAGWRASMLRATLTSSCGWRRCRTPLRWRP